MFVGLPVTVAGIKAYEARFASPEQTPDPGREPIRDLDCASLLTIGEIEAVLGYPVRRLKTPRVSAPNEVKAASWGRVEAKDTESSVSIIASLYRLTESAAARFRKRKESPEAAERIEARPALGDEAFLLEKGVGKGAGFFGLRQINVLSRNVWLRFSLGVGEKVEVDGLKGLAEKALSRLR
jgi:hypothetical protein